MEDMDIIRNIKSLENLDVSNDELNIKIYKTWIKNSKMKKWTWNARQEGGF